MTKVSLFFSLLFLFFSGGIVRSQENTHIIGGKEVEKGRYNYTVALTAFGNQGCGGVLIAPGYVVSAAHCGGYSPHVFVGRHDLTNYTEDFEIIDVEYEVIHPDYNCRRISDDIMVLKLAKNCSYAPITYNTDPDESIFVGELATAIGWGLTDNDGSDSDILLEIEVEIKSNAECDDMIDALLFTRVQDNNICGYKEDGGVCFGDSGGPLIIKGETIDSDLLIGLTSWTYGGCGNPKYPDVYARTSSFVDFITCVTSGGSDECGDVLEVSKKQKRMISRGEWYSENKLMRLIESKFFLLYEMRK